MSSEDDVTISVRGVSKRYEIYDRPRDRLLQMLVRGRRQYFREFWALRDISFEVRRGQSVGIIGRNGSGKSTLLQLICGTLNPTEGQIEVNGRIAALLELGAGFNPEFTGRENVFMAAKLLGLTQAETEARYDQIVAFADIGEFIDQPVKTYSSGMYVRLAFAVNAHVDADVLIIDEALAVGDAFFTQKCMRYLRGFMKTGTLLFVSHDTASVQSLCSKALWLDKGRLKLSSAAKEVTEAYLEASVEAVQGPSETHAAGADREGPNGSSTMGFGAGGAEIRTVRLVDQTGKSLTRIMGGEEVELFVDATVRKDLASPIVGFFIKDRLGQHLFGDNTWLSCRGSPVACRVGETLTASFAFRMPRLARGDYSVNVAIADGTQEDHVQHHWIHDALVFRSDSASVAAGLIGILMDDIRIGVRHPA
jgi:lipopolysaccharide transport system ATP-binding protein